ncbi:hypothetical protein C7I84_16825 [Mesorhizobium ephedrae]|jgi:hypothetical protein|uniref:Two-component sensor histidine kinase n=1 Tax=Kumtagia ephedrae TaxID=2116701 RepID=A0A2P7S5G1_9HYPH|nr:hypothetical protein C7I84_16825 [Mesorhizobium ephedrae]
MFRLAIRTLPVFAVIIGFAMFLAAYMNFSGVRSAYLDLIRSRMAMVAESIGTDVSTAHALGIRLTEQTTLPGLLARQAASDPLTLSIDVLSEDGTVVFSSDAGRVGVPDRAGDDPGAFRDERRLVNDFGAPVGAVLVRLDRGTIDGTIDGLRRDILNGAIPAGIGAVIAGSLACLLLLTGLHRRARRSATGAGDDPIAHAATEMERLGLDARP